MRTLEQLKERIALYDYAVFIQWPNVGYIAWHFSTGDNLEVLFIESAIAGGGGMLYRAMAKRLLETGRVPYHSVFAYRLTSNKVAERFYGRMNWTQVDLGQSIYRDDGTTLMWITWEGLLKRLEIKGAES